MVSVRTESRAAAKHPASAHPGGDLASPPPSYYSQNNAGSALPVNRGVSQNAAPAPFNPSANTGQAGGGTAAAHQPYPVRRASSAMSMEVPSWLPQVYPSPWPQRSGSDVSTTYSSGSVIVTSNNRSGASFLNRLRAALAKAALVVFYMLTSLMLAAGSALLAVGLTALVDERQGLLGGRGECCGNLPPLTTILPLLRALALLMMMAGGVIVLLGLLGCCGLLLRSKVMVGSFGFLMMLIVLGQLNFGAVAIFHKDALRCRLREALVTAVRDNYEGTPNSTNPFSQAVDIVQLTLGCCGVDGAWDFHDTPWFRHRSPGNLTLPWTCCQVQQEAAMACPAESPALLVREDCPFQPPSPGTPYTTRPCLQLVEDRMRQHFVLLLGLLLSLTLLELTVMGSAFLAASSVGRKINCSGNAAGLKR